LACGSGGSGGFDLEREITSFSPHHGSLPRQLAMVVMLFIQQRAGAPGPRRAWDSANGNDMTLPAYICR